MPSIATTLLLLRLALAAPAALTTISPSTATPPATTPAPTHAPAIGGGIIHPSFTIGSTVISGNTYPIVSGSLGGAIGFTGSDISVTGAAGGYLYNCYASIDNQIVPALCYGGSEGDTEEVVLGSATLLDAGHVIGTGMLPGPDSASFAGTVGVPGHAVAGGGASAVFTPALNPGQVANGGLGGVGSVTLGPISFGGQAGGSFVTEVSYTSAGAGAVGSLYLGPLGGAGTIGGDIVGTTKVGCAGLNVENIGYTACVTAPF